MVIEYEMSYGTPAKHILSVLGQFIAGLACAFINFYIAFFSYALLFDGVDSGENGNIFAEIYLAIVFAAWLASSVCFLIIPFIRKKVLLND